MDLFDDEEAHQLTINEHYAAAYAAKKEREELSKLRDKYGSDTDEDDEDDEESEEDEDEDGEELTPAIDAAILKTLSRIRRGDPSIYDKDKPVFEEEAQRMERSRLAVDETKRKRDRRKPITLRDMAIDALLHPERDQEVGPTHAEEQEALRAETISAFHRATAEEGADEDDLLVLRNPADDMDRTAYRQYLLENVGEEDVKIALSVDATDVPLKESGGAVASAAEETSSRRKRKARGKSAADEEFLVNYILNRGWVDESQRRNPTLEEVTGTTKGSVSDITEAVISGSLEDDSEFEDITDRFESSYNFRFEEPNAAVIPTHPRNIQSAVRRPDDQRKQQREKRRARKEEEKLAKKEELKRLKALKRREIEEKLKTLGHISGKDGIRSDQLDLEGDFDPEAHDSQMRALFDEADYYQHAEESKPTWDDDLDISDIVPEVSGSANTRRQNELAEKDWDTDHAIGNTDIDRYMEEYFNLDYNGMVGDLPTRFKYMKVPGTSHGLSAAEILLADDAELNAYMGIKKYAPYRPAVVDKRGKKYWELKEALKGRSWDGQTQDNATSKPTKRRKGKKERAKLKASQGVADTIEPPSHGEQQKPRKKQKIS